MEEEQIVFLWNMTSLENGTQHRHHLWRNWFRPVFLRNLMLSRQTRQPNQYSFKSISWNYICNLIFKSYIKNYLNIN